MEFDDTRPIYVQIADKVREAVLGEGFREEERIPSIREMAVETEVNPNTITRSYGLLQDQGIIYNRRGIGYFITEGARQKVLSIMKKDFVENELPRVFRKMRALDLSIDDILNIFHQIMENTNAEE